MKIQHAILSYFNWHWMVIFWRIIENLRYSLFMRPQYLSAAINFYSRYFSEIEISTAGIFHQQYVIPPRIIIWKPFTWFWFFRVFLVSWKSLLSLIIVKFIWIFPSNHLQYLVCLWHEDGEGQLCPFSIFLRVGRQPVFEVNGNIHCLMIYLRLTCFSNLTVSPISGQLFLPLSILQFLLSHEGMNNESDNQASASSNLPWVDVTEAYHLDPLVFVILELKGSH